MEALPDDHPIRAIFSLFKLAFDRFCDECYEGDCTVRMYCYQLTDLYILDMPSRKFRRITRHYAIETEPSWMPDGRSLLFTSDRGGRPQIYRIDIVTGRTERVTFEGGRNARPSIAADGRTMVLVHQASDSFHIAVQDLERERLQILTSTALDESPSVAPNGSMVLYATKHEGRGILAAVSVDGSVKFRLPSREGDVREPAWSPYLGGP